MVETGTRATFETDDHGYQWVVLPTTTSRTCSRRSTSRRTRSSNGATAPACSRRCSRSRTRAAIRPSTGVSFRRGATPSRRTHSTSTSATPPESKRPWRRRRPTVEDDKETGSAVAGSSRLPPLGVTWPTAASLSVTTSGRPRPAATAAFPPVSTASSVRTKTL